MALKLAMAIGMVGFAAPVLAQGAAPGPNPAPKPAFVEHIKVHSAALEGNLEGNSADRDVIVVLPPSYQANPKKRYPVIYYLHGYFAKSEMYDGSIKYGEAMSAEAARGHEFILVAPDSYTKYGGAMYSDSVAVGNFEGFIAHDLVAYVDRTYRTLAKPAARGLSGHSMGGYGTWKIAMKYPGIFSAIYAQSSCCLSARGANPATDARLETMTPEEAEKGDFGVRGNFAAASAWSPNPGKPPFYFDLAVQGGKLQDSVIAQWAANAPHAMLPQYLGSLKGLTAIGTEVGDKDFLLADSKTMHALLDKFGIKHDWSVFEGDHTNKLPIRFRENLLPFFAAHLVTK
jgi:enterochelin esterase-like enzyme